MNARYLTSAGVVLAASLLMNPPASVAAPLVVNVDLSFDQISLMGEGLMPLAEGAVADTWQDMNTGVVISQSALAPSTLSGTVTFDDVTFDVSTLFTGTFFLDLTFSDEDATFDFGGGLSSPFTISAALAKPLVVTIGLDLSFAELLALQVFASANPDASLQDAIDDYNSSASPGETIDVVVTDPGVEYAIGADINANGFADALTYFGSSIALTAALSDVDLDIAGGASITATGLSFSGGVDDLMADPPFTIDLNGTLVLMPVLPSQVPEPLTVALLGLGLIGIAALARRKGRRKV